jgi:GGDEF domain-containing protein
MANRIAGALAELHVIQGQQLHVGASIGSYLTAPGDTAASAVHFSDQSMYIAKNKPRGTGGQSGSPPRNSPELLHGSTGRD